MVVCSRVSLSAAGRDISLVGHTDRGGGHVDGRDSEHLLLSILEEFPDIVSPVAPTRACQ